MQRDRIAFRVHAARAEAISGIFRRHARSCTQMPFVTGTKLLMHYSRTRDRELCCIIRRRQLRRPEIECRIQSAERRSEGIVIARRATIRHHSEQSSAIQSLHRSHH